MVGAPSGGCLDCREKFLINLPEAKLVLVSMSDQEVIAYSAEELERRVTRRRKTFVCLEVGFVNYFSIHSEAEIFLKICTIFW